MKKLRIYIDTSIIGGCLDEEFAEPSNALLEMARTGKVNLLLSELLAEEIREAPENVREILASLSGDFVEEFPITTEALELRGDYLRAGVLGAASADDALHVALATIAHAEMIVSWNFKHIVHYEKIRGFNAVNLLKGYPQIEIRSPREVV